VTDALMLLLIDNFDSFVHNLARYFQQLGQRTTVVRNDAIDVAAARAMAPDAIILSPGPGRPRQAGVSLELVRQLHLELPILGICLGHQIIAEAFDATIVRAPLPMHGRASIVEHNERGVFAGLPNPLSVGRYHSLVVEDSSLPAELAVTARTPDGIVMAIAHQKLPIVGLQFHPESILTECGYETLAGFLRLAGLTVLYARPSIADEESSIRSAPLT
jgi:anthranilate synthase/aminodeoxychorismate synthase-like glutamine amidotransferase